VIAVFKDNGGQASALNAGFAVSKGEIICLLDADDAFLLRRYLRSLSCSILTQVLIGVY
jgi:glycosyltransferase involved in cell wall biosynthesis